MPVIDETGDVEKGRRTVRVQRQYTGTSGGIEISQVPVYLTYSGGARARADRRGAESAQVVNRRPGPLRGGRRPCRGLLRHQAGAGHDDAYLYPRRRGPSRRGWTGDEVYGANSGLRAKLGVRAVDYVLAIAGNRRLPTAGPNSADALAAALPRRARQRLSARPGAKGQRHYDWAWLELPSADRSCGTGLWWLIIRRSRRTEELTYYRSYSPTPVRLTQLVAVAGRR